MSVISISKSLTFLSFPGKVFELCHPFQPAKFGFTNTRSGMNSSWNGKVYIYTVSTSSFVRKYTYIHITGSSYQTLKINENQDFAISTRFTGSPFLVFFWVQQCDVQKQARIFLTKLSWNGSHTIISKKDTTWWILHDWWIAIVNMIPHSLELMLICFCWFLLQARFIVMSMMSSHPRRIGICGRLPTLVSFAALLPAECTKPPKQRSCNDTFRT